MSTKPAKEGRPAPPYRIETERLLLRPWEPSDAEAYIATIKASREHLGRWLGWARRPLELEAEIISLRRDRGRFDHDKKWAYGAFDSINGRILGLVGLWEGDQDHVAELGYWLAPNATGKGFATEAVGAVIRVAIEQLQFERLEILTDATNESSVRLARRLGFREEGVLRKDFRSVDGKLVDSTIFSLLASEYAMSTAAEQTMRCFDGLEREIV